MTCYLQVSGDDEGEDKWELILLKKFPKLNTDKSLQ